MKNYKTLIILLVIFGGLHYIVGELTLNHKLISYFIELANSKESIQVSAVNISYLLANLKIALQLILWLPIAIWALIDSKKCLFLPFLWCLLVIFLGFKGLIIYLLVKVLHKIETTKS